MKKKGGFFVLLVLIILSASFVTAAGNQTSTNTATKAYSCLENKVTDKCSTLSTEEKIFSLLAIERCKSELTSDSLASECWPSTGCKIKTTAQAILGFNHVNADTTKAENWLLSQTFSSSDLDWFLQVDATGQASCTATYPSGSYSFTVNDDKTITGSSGSCLKTTAAYPYWLQVLPACYDKELKISCHNSFLTSLMYKKKTSLSANDFYVSQKTDSASAEGTTTVKVSSSCFKEGGTCTYEGTLWASMVLKYKGHDVSSYIPYLVAMADVNAKYIPEAFLYYLTNNFRTELLARQQENKFWLTSGDKFYDTAVALLPFQNEQITEKSNSITWLGEVQGTDGCWQGNIRNTAFLLYSIWPKKTANVSTAKDCENSGYNCMSSASCTSSGGNVLTDYTGCFANLCCNKVKQLETCSQQNGELCSSDESCLGGSTVSASDTAGGKSCCVDGTCGTQQQNSECELQGGFCKSTCSNNEQYSSYSCSSGNCCIQKASGGINIWVIIILIILIVLVLIGIIFRKKLRVFFSKIKFGKGKGKPVSSGGPRFPPASSPRGYPIQRRIMQPQSRLVRRPSSQGKSEFDDILRKLKEIGK